jgi:hypothetical protein
LEFGTAFEETQLTVAIDMLQKFDLRSSPVPCVTGQPQSLDCRYGPLGMRGNVQGMLPDSIESEGIDSETLTSLLLARLE